jgi:D-alanyl-D-alanine dipeptidase
MNLRIGLFLIAIAAAAPALAKVPLRPGCDELALSRLKNAKQIVTVFSENWDSSEATVRTWERSDSGWKPVFAPEPAMIGRAGMAWGHEFSVHSKGGSPKKEGDGRSPAGVFPMGSEFGFDAPKGEDKFLALKPTTHCVDDVSSKHYNKIVDEKVGVDWKSSEKMRSIDVYKYGIEVAYPSSAEDKAGSCIFFHIWKGPGKPTAGCTSLPEASMKKLIAWMKPETAVAVFLPENEVPAWSHCLP